MLKSKTKIMMLIATAAISYNVMHTTKVKAEGTKDMVKNAGYRAYTEWTSNDTYASIPRQTKLNVFVNAGETINLGSSVIVSNPAKDYEIYVTKPNGTRTGYHVDKNTGLGYIDSVQKESAGPNPSSGGYTPITITADTSGVWKVEFRGSGKHADDPTEPGYYNSNGTASDKSGIEWDAKSVRTSSAIQKVTDDFMSAQGNTIGAWDITVKDMTGSEKKGRVFTSYVSLFVGKNSSINGTATTAAAAEKVINSDFYVLTKDGYVYKTSMNGLDPNGFLFFSNNRGFVDSTSNMTLYHSVVEDTAAAKLDGSSNTLRHILGNVSPQRPDVADTATDITHNVFFNYPSKDLPSNLSPEAIAPAVPQNFNFTGNTGTQSKTQLSNGGTFSFVADKASSYRLVIDTDGTGGFNLATDKVIENVCVAGKNTVTWDGTDKSGKKLPVGTYSAHLIMKGGEYHFPMLDAEHNPFGIKVQLMNAPGYANPSDYTDKYKVYYDESNYTTSNNTTVNLDAGNTKYNINPISALNGVDSSNGANAYFQNFGDVKGIDTWTYFPGQAVDLAFEVTPTVSDFSKSGNEDTNITFAATDFINKFQAGTTNNLSKIQITSLPTNGQLQLNGSVVTINQEITVDALSNLVFVPNTNWNGNVSFDWIGSNGTIYSANTAKANITIIPVNDAPTAVNDAASTNEKTPVIIRVLDNDSDVEGDALHIISTSSPLFGKVIVNLDGTITYTPNVGYHGHDAFTYTISDGNGGTATATVNVIVNAIPVVSNYDKEADFNTPLNDKVVSTDADGDNLTFEKASDPVHGSLVVNNDGTWTYTPNKDFGGADSFTVKVNDGHGGTAVSTISVTVDTPPVVGNYDKSVDFNKSVSDKVIATDVNGDSLTYSKESDPNHGTVVVNTDGSWTYTPNTSFSGADSFTVKVNDGHGGTAVSTISVTVDAPPAVGNYNKNTDFNKSVSDKVIATDVNGDTLTYSKGNDPTHGTVVVNEDGTWRYTPSKDFSGADSFEVLVNDGHGGTAVSTISITVDTPPVVGNYDKSVDFNKSVSDKVIATDVNGDVLTYSKESDPSHGTVVVNNDGTWVYTPNKDFSGTDSFKVLVDDGHGGTAISIVNLKVDSLPIVSSYGEKADFNKPISGKVIATDVDKDSLSYSKASDPTHGTVVVNEDGTWTYTPNKDFSGEDSFKVLVNDGHGGTAISTISVTVDAPPAVGNYDKIVDFNKSLSDKVIATDVNGDSLTYSKESDPSHGTVVVNNDGTWTYTPNKDFSGEDSFTVKVDDGHGGTAVSTISVTVDAPPAVGNYDKSVDFNKPLSDKVIATDVNGDVLTYSKESDPSHGTVVVNNDGTWVYTPNKDFSGSDSFKVLVNDGHGGTAISIVNLKVDSLPIVSNYGEKADFNKPVSGKVIATDVDKDNLTYSKVSDPIHGTVVVNEDGTWTYTPNKDFSGTDSFTVKVEDGHGGSATSLVMVNVNTPPMAVDDYKAINQDNSVVIDILGNDVDVDKDQLSVISVSQPQHGKAVINEDGTITYTPNAGYTGTEDFTYTISDGHNGTSTAHITIRVNAIPVIPSFYKEVNVNSELKDKVIASDADIEDMLTYVKASNPSHGSVVVNPDGSYVYTPNTDYVGYDSFTIKVSDDHGGTAISTINIRVNSIPTLTNYDEKGDFNKPVSDKLIGEDKDGDSLTYSKVSDPTHGTVVVNNDGTWTYNPNKDFSGTDSFTVKATDGHGGTVTATVTVKVDTPPVAVNDEVKTNESTEVKINVLSNDSDLDKDSLKVISVSQPEHGKAMINSDGSISYTPNAGYHGIETFTYTISDGHNGTATATVRVDVNATPVVGNYEENTDYNKSVSDKVVASDADGDVLTYSKASDPSHGAVTVNSDGTWVYTPNKDFSGADSFTVMAKDGHGASVISTINITVNTPPTAINDNAVTDEDTSVNINILNNDKDVNNDALTVTAVTNPTHGNVAINSDGTVKYTPFTNYNGNDSFTYTISDGHGGTATATVNIIVNPINDAPTVPNYDKTTTYNKSISSRVQGTDVDGDTLQYTLRSQAKNGYVTVSSNGTWTYTPNFNYAGSDSFTVEVSDGHGKTAISTINITVRDKADLVGTVRNISTGKVVPNATIQLSDLAGRLIYTTTTDANGNYAISNVKLGIYDFKVSNAQYRTINDEFDVEPSSETNYTVRKDFQVSDALTYSLNLTASPNTILGDGISTSVLTTRVVDSNNNPVSNVQVNFSADGGSFPNGAVAVTDKDGIAKVIFKSANVSGTEPQKIHVSASVDDKAHNLQAFDQIIMTFEPGVIVGVVIDNDTNLPISNAVVEVSKDFDGDGIADFYSKVITGADGKYTIAIPRGNTDYKVEITKPVKVGNSYENVKFTQNSKVGEIIGTKTEQYSSEETVAGVILSKQTDGKVAMLKDDSLFSIEVLNKADGSSAGNVRASFVNGVFEAEGLEKGKSYTIAINYTFPSGQKIAIGTATVNVNTDGQINLTSMLIDPYGTITDSITNGIIDGVKVQLYYADTERNRAAGRTPNTLVNLPKVPGFAPADNENPQIDDVNGKYAFMVFPEADYYLVATKDGYDTFVSETISVEKNIVKRDISMNQVKKPAVTTPIVSNPVVPTKETPQPEKTATIIQELPKTGSVVDFNTLSILGLMLVASGVGITLTKKKN